MSCSHGWQVASFGPEVATLGLGVAALRYASWGYAVLPVERGGKKPHRMLPPEGGVHWACTDPARIREWWSNDPLAGIGVATGQASALAVIDLDCKNGNDGLASFITHAGPGVMSSYPLARTPSGGYHIWMRTPAWAAVPERPGILPGVDVKGDGGYVLAAPSAKLVMPDGRDGERVEPLPVPYEWVNGCPCSVPDAPDWLPGWLASAPVNQHGVPLADPMPDVETLKQTGIAEGQRNVTIYRLACKLYRQYGTSVDASMMVVADIRDIWGASNTRDFNWREVLVCIESARKFIERQDRMNRLMMESAREWLRGQ